MENPNQPCVPLIAALPLHARNEIEILAFVRVDHDDVEPGDDNSFQRTIQGTVEQRGEQWGELIAQAENFGGLVRFAIFGDGGVYENLIIEMDNDKIRLEMSESFHGTVDDYRAEINRRYQLATEKWKHRLTGN